MKKNYTISINPFAEFITSTSEAKKLGIIKQSKKHVTFIVAPYRTARTRMQKFFKNGFDKSEILNGISLLQTRNPLTDYSKRDVKNSIEALRQFLTIQFPPSLGKLKCSFSSAEEKEVTVNGVRIKVAPDLIIRWEEKGQKYIGAVKFHISKSGQFDIETSTFAAIGIHQLLEKKVKAPDEIVHPLYCLSVDIFACRVTSVPRRMVQFKNRFLHACLELKLLWNKV